MACAAERLLPHPEARPVLGALVYVHWDRDRTAVAYPSLVQRCRRLGLVVVVVDNSGTWPGLEADLVLRHDNANLEFGAWQRGVSAVLESASPEVFVLVNDRFASYGRPYLGWITPASLALCADLGAVAGALDRYQEPIRTFGGRLLDGWVTTPFFVVGAETLRRYGRLDRFPAGPTREELVERAGVSVAHLELLNAFLLRGSWHRAGSLVADGPALDAKIAMILNEQHLSVGARELRLPVVSLRVLHQVASARSTPAARAVMAAVGEGSDARDSDGAVANLRFVARLALQGRHCPMPKGP